MFRIMVYWCVKRADNLWQYTGKSCEILSTLVYYTNPVVQPCGAKVAFIPKPFHRIPPRPSPVIISSPPLAEHYFYPVSTPLTISTARLKFKER